MLKIAGYYAVFTPVSTWGGDYLAETLGWNEYLVTILNLVFNLVTEYTFQRLVVYGKKVDNRKKKVSSLKKKQPGTKPATE